MVPPNNQDLEDQEIVVLEDESGRSLECYVENYKEQKDCTYLLLLPVGTPAIILAWGEDEEFEDEDEDDDDIPTTRLVDEVEELNEIFADAKAVLAELNLTLKNTAYQLTLTGELPPIEEDDILALEMDEEDTEADEMQFLASFYHHEQHYSIYTPISPLLLIAKEDARGKISLVDSEDPQWLTVIEALMDE